MTTEKLWHVIYWQKGRNEKDAKTLTAAPVSYRDARAKAKRCRYLPGFGGCVITVKRHFV